MLINKPASFQLSAVLPLLLIVSSVGVLSSCSGQQTAQESPSVSPPVTGVAKTEVNPLNAGLEGTDRPGTDPLSLMQNPQVKQELSLTDDQVAQIKTIEQDFRASIKQEFSGIDWKSLDAKTRDQKFTEVSNKTKQEIESTRGKVGKVFKPEQLQRFKEITLQIYGFGALSYDQFADDLKLSADQKKQLSDIRDQLGKKVRANLTVPNANDQDSVKKAISDNRKRTEQIFQASNQQAVAVLTPEQQKSLEKLRGKEFKFQQTPPT
jgi:Spy/CpxP family protein refolding chaperone